MNTMHLQEAHDRLMGLRPETASHPEDCPFCTEEYASFVDNGGSNVSESFTKEEVDALVSAAVAAAISPLQAELDEFRAGAETAEVDAQIAAVRTEMQTQIDELTSKLDAAVLEAEAAKTEHANVMAFLEAEAAAVVEAAEAETRKADRIAKVAEVVAFPDEYVAERAEKWASLSDEDFEALLADYKALGEKSPKPGTGADLPKATAMVASRETASGNSKMGSALSELIRNRENPRAIR